jgi:glycosyltransferase involved in cell wall biosynthesis
MLIGIDASRALVARRTGTENYSLFVIRALTALAPEHRFRLYCRETPPEGLLPHDERVEWRVIPFPRLWSLLRLSWEMLRRPPDVLFVPAHVVPPVHPRATVVTIHDVGYLHYPQAHGAWARRYLHWSTGHSVRAARRVVVDSLATQRDLAQHYGVPERKMRVAYPAGVEGLHAVHDAERRRAVQERLGTGPRYLLFLGTLQPRKNLETLIRAFQALMAAPDTPADLRLVLAGPWGWLSEGIRRAVTDPALRGRVVVPGFVAADDLAPLLSGAAAFVMPSWYEGFGLPILEAMACDVPVICSRVGSLPEVAGDAALLIDPSSQGGLVVAMARVLADVSLRSEMIAKGRHRVAAFSWSACAREVLKVFTEAAEEAR